MIPLSSFSYSILVACGVSLGRAQEEKKIADKDANNHP